MAKKQDGTPAEPVVSDAIAEAGKALERANADIEAAAPKAEAAEAAAAEARTILATAVAAKEAAVERIKSLADQA